MRLAQSPWAPALSTSVGALAFALVAACGGSGASAPGAAVTAGGAVDAGATSQDGGGSTSEGGEGAAPVRGTLSVTDVAFFQGPKARIVTAGVVESARNSPVIANRAGILRVYVAPSPDFTPRDIVAEL